MNAPLWSPSPDRIAGANLTRFIAEAERRFNRRFVDYDALHAFSIDQLEEFWRLMWDFGKIVTETRGDRVVDHAERMPGARCFPDARLNFAENVLRGPDDRLALSFQGEDRVRRTMTLGELRAGVARTAGALRAARTSVFTL